MYTNRNENVKIGKIQPIMGTRIEGKNEAAIAKFPVKLHYNSRRAYCKSCYFFLILKIFNTALLGDKGHRSRGEIATGLLSHLQSLSFACHLGLNIHTQ